MVDDKYIDAAFDSAKKFIRENPSQNSSGAHPLFHSRIRAGDAKLREAVSLTIDDLLSSAPDSAQETTGKRKITYLGGAAGVKEQLLEFADDHNKKSPDIKELRSLLRTSLPLEFSEYQEKFKAHSKEPQISYANIEPLMHGINAAMNKIAEESGLNIIRDNSLSSLRLSEETKSVKADIENEQKSANLHIFAVALTPKQARETAAKFELPITGEKAEQSAHNFNAIYNDFLKDKAENMTLLDAEGKALLVKRKGEILSINEDRLKEWQKNFDTAKSQNLNVSSLIGEAENANHNNIQAPPLPVAKGNITSLHLS